MNSLEHEIAAWLETVAADTSETIRQTPDSTIVPTVNAADTAGRRALAILEELSRVGPTGSAQIRTGETLGEGGMGVVRIAEQVALGRTVAVKTLREDRRDEAATLNLLREAWVTGALEHPNVVPIYTIGLEPDGRPQIVLKRIEGVEWSELMHDPAQVADRFGAADMVEWNLQILIQVLNALRFAHRRGILHRDVKPENVMVGEYGEVYLLDWGIAVSLRDDDSGRMPLAADATEMAGTPCYMAPEMLGAERGVPLSARTDVYLVGAVLFEILAGQPPHLGETALEVITKVATSEPALPADAPADLAAICQRAMARNPDDRFASADEMQQALQRYLQHRGSARLAERAAADLAELERAAGDTDSEPAARRDQVYRLFGACRFGFHEALSSWRENPAARQGLVRATSVVAELELADGDPRTAVSLLATIDDPPAELVARAKAAVVADQARVAELHALERQYDWTIGTRTRAFVAGLIGVVATALPTVAAIQGVEIGLNSYAYQVTFACGFMLGVIALGTWARESMMKTVVNQRVFGTMVFLFGSQAALWVGCWRAGVPIIAGQMLMIFLWFSVAGMFALAVDRRLTPTALAYLAAFWLATAWPTQRFWFMAASNFVLLVNAVWVWRPTTILPTNEERLALGLPPKPGR